jgi:hypothetical protein
MKVNTKWGLVTAQTKNTSGKDKKDNIAWIG